MKRSEL